ncbi:ABC transporter permease [Conexibacter sp. JD483]|uniref:ABC transporter permease n=1 Tax=unclassified Conexibacter TaxID=2627773 RepID=UPI00272233F3|nr:MULTISPECIES: ABC transporter permease [unclassified Conexibacter]MDO8187065.1 ABC transporter permease [Conexibacter sp. CPCC 205706]MDO8200923.1 ABC transporter permease [Conexibacter sp. CPCC 205762]MDR9371305.1 ABC transporter permease [Conexibacter sp. JD483]
MTPVGTTGEAAATEPGAPAPTARKSGPGELLTRLPDIAPLVLLLLALGIFFSIKSEFFLNYDNFLNILTAAAITGIIAAPATLLMVSGQVDLSVGSALTFCGVVMAYVADKQGIFLGIVAAVAAGLLVACINGTLVTVIGVNPLITTLATLAAFAGLARVIADGQTLPLNGFSTLGTSRPFFDIPLPVIIFAVVVIGFYVLMRYTVIGRSMYAIGANPVAARLTGLRTGRLIFIGFLLSGAFVALAALINVSQLSAASTQAGNGLELSVITAVVLGGASLAGGRGTIVGTLFGLLVIAVLNNGLTLLSVNSFWQDVARGTLLALAVSFDQLRLRLTRE